MSDLVSRQAAIDAIKNADVIVFYDEETTADDVAEVAIVSTKKSVVASIEELPSAQPERKRGKWIDEGFYADGHGAHAFRCSECGGHIIEYDADPFCRWCGADMRGEKRVND